MRLNWAWVRACIEFLELTWLTSLLLDVPPLDVYQREHEKDELDFRTVVLVFLFSILWTAFGPRLVR
jgi:hypothetical protein